MINVGHSLSYHCNNSNVSTNLFPLFWYWQQLSCFFRLPTQYTHRLISLHYKSSTQSGFGLSKVFQQTENWNTWKNAVGKEEQCIKNSFVMSLIFNTHAWPETSYSDGDIMFFRSLWIGKFSFSSCADWQTVTCLKKHADDRDKYKWTKKYVFILST